MPSNESSTSNDTPSRASSSNQVYVDLLSEAGSLEQAELDTIFDNEPELVGGSDGRPSSVTTIDTDGRTSTLTVSTDGLDLETPQRSRKKRRTPSSDPTTDLIYELISSRKPNPVDFLPTTTVPKDHLDHFFESLASTMRTFPALSVAKLKLKMLQLVGEEEVSLAQQRQSTQFVYFQAPNESLGEYTGMTTTTQNETHPNALPMGQTVQNADPNNSLFAEQGSQQQLTQFVYIQTPNESHGEYTGMIANTQKETHPNALPMGQTVQIADPNNSLFADQGSQQQQ